MRKRFLLIVSSIVILFGSIIAGCSSETSTATPTPYPTPVKKTFTVQRGDIVINTELFGTVTPLAIATVYFQMDGHVGNVYAQVNDTVKKGQLLADLVELKDLQAKAVDTTETIQRAQIAVDIAQLNLDKLKAIGASSYDIQLQEKQLELAQLDLNDTLVKYGIDPSSNALDDLAASVNKAKAFAPVDGVVISGVNAGRGVSTTTSAFTIGDGSRSEIDAAFSPGKADDTLKDMYEGMPVEVTPNNNPSVKWTGKIRLLPSPYGTGSADDKTVHVVLDQTSDASQLKFGDTVSVNIQLANKTGILWLPPAAIRQVGSRTFVIVNGSNGPKRLDIEIGLQTADRVEILSGLDENQVVIGQ